MNNEFEKSARANELLRQQNNQLTDRERQAQQAARAVELEKEDILGNYRDACQQIDRLQETVDKVSEENRELYGQLQQAKTEVGGAAHHLNEHKKKEENYV